MDIAGLSESRRPDTGNISIVGHHYNWLGQSVGVRLKEVAIIIFSRLQSFVIGAISLNEHTVPVKFKNTLGFIYLIAEYATTEMCELEETAMFYAKPDI